MFVQILGNVHGLLNDFTFVSFQSRGKTDTKNCRIILDGPIIVFYTLKYQHLLHVIKYNWSVIFQHAVKYMYEPNFKIILESLS